MVNSIAPVLPVFAIVGRPNVGKSTLFNCLTKSRDALVVDQPGVTRDRQYGEGECDECRFIVIDTGGIESGLETQMQQLMTQQTLQAIQEADGVLFVVSVKDGLTQSDQKIAEKLRHFSKPVFVAINKSEGVNEDEVKLDFYQFGFEKIFAIASAHNLGVKKMLRDIIQTFNITPTIESISDPSLKIAVVGRPNVGKSTLINRLLGEERVVVLDEPGTTIDSIFIPFMRNNQSYTLIDTAGVRRRTKINEQVEKFSVIKTLQTIEAANVVIFILSAREGVNDQDLRLLDFVVDTGKALVIAFNKWDNMSSDSKDQVKKEIDRRLEFVNYAKIQFISALYGTGVGDLFKLVTQAYAAATKKISAAILTRLLQEAVVKHQPPLVQGRRIKLRFAHPGGHNPPIIVIHGNQTENLSQDYIRYLISFFRKKLRLVGTPIRIQLKTSENPYKDKKNLLTPRQMRKKKRLLNHLKTKKNK